MKRVCTIQGDACLNAIMVEDTMLLSDDGRHLSGPAKMVTVPIVGGADVFEEHYTATLDAPDGCTFLVSETVGPGHKKIGDEWVEPEPPAPPARTHVSLDEFLASLTDSQVDKLLASKNRAVRLFLLRAPSTGVDLADQRTAEMMDAIK